MILYQNVMQAFFLSRPNRFVALCRNLSDEIILCHVKNTGRLRELLEDGAEVYVNICPSPHRKTSYDLIAVRKNGILFNIDSQAPNKVFKNALEHGILGFVPDRVFPEQTFEDSRFDFAYEHKGSRGYLEVKGVTLLDGTLALFPDAPTLRGIKHLEGLCRLARSGIQTHAAFVLQFEGAAVFAPNTHAHPDFADHLRAARDAGVCLHAFSCRVSPCSMNILPEEIPILL